MSELQKVKDKLINEDKLEALLEAIGCEYVKSEQRGELITARLPERFYSENKRSVQIKVNEYLSCAIRSRADFRGDIFNLVSYIQFDKRGADLQGDLHNSKEFICKLFGWNQFLKGYSGIRDIEVKDYTASMKEILNGRRRKREIKTNPTLPEETMNQFYFYDKPLPYKAWIDEGISVKTQIKYGIGFDLESKRVVIPLRNRFGNLVGVKGRIMKDSDDPERKYLYLYSCNNRYEWFNFWNAHEHILSEKRVYIFESEKSCMKAYQYGIYNTVSIGSSEISWEQAEAIRQLGLDVEVVLCYDKGITADEVLRNAKMFKGREAYAIFDTNNILSDKNSPIDEGLEKWNFLIENNVYEIDTDSE